MIKINTSECRRCGHTWIPRKEQIVVCPKCHSAYWNKPTGIELGKQGEELVHALLPNSVWLNKDKEKFYSYDIEWEGIRIDVKIMSEKRSVVGIYPFSDYQNGSIIYVLVGLSEKEPYFWIGAIDKKKIYKNTESISAQELPNAIREEREKLRI